VGDLFLKMQIIQYRILFFLLLFYSEVKDWNWRIKELKKTADSVLILSDQSEKLGGIFK
jgi:hypothetical protein